MSRERQSAGPLSEAFPGLIDAVESIEERFDVLIPDHELTGLTTVMDIATLVEEQRGFTGKRPRPGWVFRSLRDVLVERLDVERARIRPSMPLRDIFPFRSRVARWASLGMGLGERGIGTPSLGWWRPGVWLTVLLVIPTIVLFYFGLGGRHDIRGLTRPHFA